MPVAEMSASTAGADIKELASLSYPQVYLSDYLRGLSEGVSNIKKPIIAAVSGHAVSIIFWVRRTAFTLMNSAGRRFRVGIGM